LLGEKTTDGRMTLRYSARKKVDSDKKDEEKARARQE
jgi:hypothetical protein